MVFSAIRKAPLAVALMLGCATLPAQAGWFSSDDKPAPKAESKPAAQQPVAQQPAGPSANSLATNLEDSIRQAQLLRLASQYPEAIKHLSQLMMVAADDPRVITEYGKTLASMGRASDAVNFLTRAQQLQPADWTIYSAMGVAYDQLGDQKNAQNAYEHALALKPGEPSVLNNYALSRMLAKDPEAARKLVALAESAGGASDSKIARNIAMIRSMAPEAPVPAPVAAATPQAPVAHTQTATALQAAPQTAKPAAQAGSPATHDSRVVMQRVPVDPQAGPVAAKPAPVNTATASTATVSTATHPPRALQPQVAEAAHSEPHIEAPKPVMSQSLPPIAPVKAAEPARPAPATIAATPVTTAPAAIAKVTPPAPVKPATPAPMAKVTPPVPATETATASVSLRLAPPLKGEADKPAAPPKVLPPAPVKAAASKETVPGLRVSASAY
jgi:Flp pilus assembly protein TadD